jgi:hypothetical protein
MLGSITIYDFKLFKRAIITIIIIIIIIIIIKTVWYWQKTHED